jgi:hypothetical protein
MRFIKKERSQGKTFIEAQSGHIVEVIFNTKATGPK